MNDPRAIQQRERSCFLPDLVVALPRSGVFIAGDRRATRAQDAEMTPAAQVVEKPRDHQLPAWRTDVTGDKRVRWQHHRTAAARAIAELQNKLGLRDVSEAGLYRQGEGKLGEQEALEQLAGAINGSTDAS